ncbi:hypothetical protein OG416_39030 (plasmid) [Streptomyces longwoodensis]|uniref:hypothetical protein n=1 Tax=Streptomyces longwoodensis TaxID=68231 RepID=UPI00352E174E|nr:hypothetical protein OG416_39030 [Streptomyces longwoodensis]
MRNPLRPLIGRVSHAFGVTLGAVGVVEDVVATVRSHRLTKADNKQLADSARNAALAEARRGCTHLPACPPAAAPDRMKAVEVWADDACVYLCNGLVLAARETQAPDSPSGLYTPMPEKETTL